MKRVFSCGFNLFQKEKLNLKQAKAYCSENILYHVIELIRRNNFDSEEIESINEFINQELLSYLLLKYPISDEK